MCLVTIVLYNINIYHCLIPAVYFLQVKMSSHFSLKTPDGPLWQWQPNFKADHLHTCDDEGLCTLSAVSIDHIKALTLPLFYGMYLPGTTLMDSGRYHNNNISYERGNLLEKTVSSYDYTPIVQRPHKRSNPSTQHVLSHEMSKPS